MILTYYKAMCWFSLAILNTGQVKMSFALDRYMNNGGRVFLFIAGLEGGESLKRMMVGVMGTNHGNRKLLGWS